MVLNHRGVRSSGRYTRAQCVAFSRRHVIDLDEELHEWLHALGAGQMPP